MKKLLFLSLVLSSVFPLHAQLFTQDFSSSTTVADYVSTIPNSGQFNSISPNVTDAVTSSITNGALRFARTAAASMWIYRNYNFTTNPTFVQLKFDFEATDNLVGSQTPIYSVFIGSDFSTANTAAASNYASRFGILAQATAGSFKLGTVDNIGGAPSTAAFSGKQTITFVVNNSGSEQVYNAPNGTSELVANTKMDIWVGTTRGINDFSLKNTDIKGIISGFKIQASSSSGTGTYDFDNIEFTDLLGTGVIAPSATPNVKSASAINVFPNPTVGALELNNLPANIETINLNLYSIDSKLIESKTYNVNNGSVRFDLSDKAKGAYFIKGNAGNPFTVKVIKR